MKVAVSGALVLWGGECSCVVESGDRRETLNNPSNDDGEIVRAPN